jgi:hypothetical protein
MEPRKIPEIMKNPVRNSNKEINTVTRTQVSIHAYDLVVIIPVL